ncbi:hypothetical protein Pcinc_037252 [Petrolisthes cinctipes]|uniref:Ig-like domain-containing protein n=1 Tax=Petrolisthes cinctipes TaxID=88211 RepID=A0AAE1BST2_PETCI|nr:hypothetical protein Pcinc_037252 [Petrolisthes cinctipes]
MFLSTTDSPYFEGPVQNVTVQVGRTAKLTCQVENLGHYKVLVLVQVAWGYKGTGAVLTVDLQVITNNHHITIQREQRSTWVLSINHITMKDQGWYWCQVNTSPPRSITGYLAVVEPPVLEGGDEDVTVSSGDSTNLTCHAHGNPTPSITWVREDAHSIRLSSTLLVKEVVGETLALQQVNQDTAGSYLCVASNGHPPSVSKRVKVKVNFAPVVKGGKGTMWALVGGTVSFSCLYAAHPTPNLVWRRDNNYGSHQLSQESFTVTLQDGHPPYTHNMTLNTRNLVLTDFGRYTCIVNNTMGEAEASTVLKELVTTTTTTTSTTTTTTTTTTTSTTTTTASSKTTIPPSRPLFGEYDDSAKNLTAPLVLHTSPDVAKGECHTVVLPVVRDILRH